MYLLDNGYLFTYLTYFWEGGSHYVALAGLELTT